MSWENIINEPDVIPGQVKKIWVLAEVPTWADKKYIKTHVKIINLATKEVFDVEDAKRDVEQLNQSIKRWPNLYKELNVEKK